MRKKSLILGVVALIALAGCSGLSGDQPGVDDDSDEDNPSPDEGVDTDDDGEIDREFETEVISGVNNNAYSFDVTMDTNYTLQTGDVVLVEYPDVDNPDEPGEYTVETRLNDQQMADATVSIE
ncbi:hypothetical protein [Halovenus halobia]|uniref:hypothetical protein n=1 Tax=Halovenus halobia TaxID=3396622 RepID=UPI003F546FB2